MKLGLIGYPLGHSWSPEIHHFFLKDCSYDLWPLKEDELDAFFEKRDFDGLNVTIPYKKTVMSYLDEIDETAALIGAVNTIVNRNGRLKGYNTDWTGFAAMLETNRIDPGYRAVILGSGGASKAVQAALRSRGTAFDVASTSGSGTVTYEEMYQRQAEYSVLINSTPVGMSPNDDAVPADLENFTELKAVVDIVANPLRTSLCFEAQQRGIPSAGGFEMLVRQALEADRLFTGQQMDEEPADACMQYLYRKRRSIVLIGMPTSGKSTIARIISEKTGRKLIEMDEILTERLGTSISECFAQKGEAHFRSMEADLCRELKASGRTVISCGGGVIKNRENMRCLSENGVVVWIDRSPELLYGSDGRPLSKSHEDIERLYRERRELYERYSDIRICNDGDISEAVTQILEAAGEKEL